jgi:predicted nucleic acid-binding protein
VGRLYVDTSAYLCVLLGERGHKLLARELAGRELVSSVVLVLEATRNLVRLSREGVLPAGELQACLTRLDEDSQRFLLRDLTLDLCRGTRMPVVTTPRSLDLAHLRTALWFHEREPLSRFVTLDETQAAAAREAGLPV